MQLYHSHNLFYKYKLKKMIFPNKICAYIKHDINTISGFSTDGEFKSLRTMGSYRPVSVIQLMMDAKKEVKAMNARYIENCLLPYKGKFTFAIFFIHVSDKMPMLN